MASLLDIAGAPKTVDVGGTGVPVYGVSARGVAALMARFPEVGKLMSGVEVDKAALAKLAPEALAAFIAAGCGKPDDPEFERIADGLSVGAQLDLADEILRQTFPRGIGPFADKLRALGVLAQLEDASQSARPSPDQ